MYVWPDSVDERSSGSGASGLLTVLSVLVPIPFCSRGKLYEIGSDEHFLPHTSHSLAASVLLAVVIQLHSLICEGAATWLASRLCLKVPWWPVTLEIISNQNNPIRIILSSRTDVSLSFMWSLTNLHTGCWYITATESTCSLSAYCMENYCLSYCWKGVFFPHCCAQTALQRLPWARHTVYRLTRLDHLFLRGNRGESEWRAEPQKSACKVPQRHRNYLCFTPGQRGWTELIQALRQCPALKVCLCSAFWTGSDQIEEGNASRTFPALAAFPLGLVQRGHLSSWYGDWRGCALHNSCLTWHGLL